MLDIQIDDFCKDTALIFDALYRVFPRNTDILVDQICGSDELDEFGLHSRRHEACLSTMFWLANEGLIRYENTIEHEGISQATLSNRGFSLLCLPNNLHFVALNNEMPPECPETVGSYIRQINQLLPTHSSENTRTLILQLLRQHARYHQQTYT